MQDKYKLYLHHRHAQYTYIYWVNLVFEHSNKNASGHIPDAQCALKFLMILKALQFALRIAFCCVHHRCRILDIHC